MEIQISMKELNGLIAETYDITINMHLFEVCPGMVYEYTLGEPK